MNSLQLSEIFKRMPELHTERLRLKKLKVSYYSDMFEYASNPVVTKYLLWSPHDSPDYTKRFLKQIQSAYKNGTYYEWAVTLKKTGKMIGTCGFIRFDTDNNSTEVGYVMNPMYWGNGYAPEALREVIRYGFVDLRLNRIQARFIKGNESSLRVMEKAGMTFEGYLRESMFIKDGFKDIGYAAITYSDFISV